MRLWRRIINLFQRERVEAEIEAELRAHLEMAAEDEVRAGMSEEEAQRSARLRFGNPQVMRERTVGADAAIWMEGLWRNVKFALRQMKKAPGFTATAVLTLALGIGGVTAVFTLVQQVMLRSLPVARPQQLWHIGDSDACCHSNGYTQNLGTQNDWSLFSWQTYKLFRTHTPAFKHLAAFELGMAYAELAVRRSGSATPPKSRNGEYVSGNFFRTLGVSAWRGRLFTDTDDREGAPPVAVMSYHTWQEKYGADPSVVGATYEINGHAFTVIGIAPPGFYGAKVATWGMPDFWLPLATEPMLAGASSRLNNPAAAWLALIGRVRPGTNPEVLQAQLRGELHDWLASHVQDMNAKEKALWRDQTLRLTPGGAGVSLMRAQYKGGLRLLMIAALCVLLLANANLANLMLARGLRNRQQMAVRVALGSTRLNLVRKALVESLVLAMIGGAAGVGIAWAGAKLILHLAYSRSSQSSWVPLQASPSLPVLWFALGVSIVTGVVFGVLPAWISLRAEPVEAMRGANRTTGGNRHWVQKTLVVVQVAVSLVLLSVAAMLGQSLRNQEHENLGFNPRGRYLVSIDPKLSDISVSQLGPLFQEIDARLRAIPGVRSVGAVLEAPPGGWMTHNIRIEGQPEPAPRADMSSGWTRVTPGFFPTYGDRIVIGRPITDNDTAVTQAVAVVNEAFARKFFRHENPIGQHFGPVSAGSGSERNAGMYKIVGVAENIAFDGKQKIPMYFLPEAQSTHFENASLEGRELWSHYLYDIVIWASGNPPGLEARVKSALAKVDPGLMMYGMQSYAETTRDRLAQQGMIAKLTWLFGAIGLALAALGLYGVTAYGVEQRRTEIGVRMALGANRASVIALVLRRAFGPVGLGLVLGIPAAIGAGQLIASQLYTVNPWNPALLGVAILFLGLAACVAAWLPARRAASVDPMQVLRME